MSRKWIQGRIDFRFLGQVDFRFLGSSRTHTWNKPKGRCRNCTSEGVRPHIRLVPREALAINVDNDKSQHSLHQRRQFQLQLADPSCQVVLCALMVSLEVQISGIRLCCIRHKVDPEPRRVLLLLTWFAMQMQRKWSLLGPRVSSLCSRRFMSKIRSTPGFARIDFA